MSFSINTNLGALAALQTLNATAQALNNTENQVSTGQVVSSAANNPAVYAIAQTMNANIAGLTAVQDNLSFGQSVLTTASNAGAQISSQLASLQQTVTQGEQSGISATTMNNQITSILSNISEFGNNATFNGVNILGTTSTPGVTSANLNILATTLGGTISVASQITGGNTDMVTQLGLSGLTVSSGALQFAFNSSFAPAAGDYLQLSNGTSNWVFQIQHTGAAASAVPSGYLLGANGTGGTNYISNVAVSATASPTSVLGSMITSLQQQGFNAALDNSGNLTITGNNVALTAGADKSAFMATGTAYTAAPITNEAGTTVSAISSTTGALAIVAGALSSMNTIAATIGAAQQEVTGMQNFSSSLSTSITTGVGALTDANMAAESAQLVSLQTKQQLAIQTLAIANAQPQVLLNLFH